VDFVHFTTYGAGVMASILANGMQPLLSSQLQKAVNDVTQAGSAVQVHPAGSVQR
jgi:hypothetical protein